MRIDMMGQSVQRKMHTADMFIGALTMVIDVCFPGSGRTVFTAFVL